MGYPKVKYNVDKTTGALQTVTLNGPEDEAEFAEWFESPADVGVETCPAKE